MLSIRRQPVYGTMMQRTVFESYDKGRAVRDRPHGFVSSGRAREAGRGAGGHKNRRDLRRGAA